MNSFDVQEASILLDPVLIRGLFLRHSPPANLSGASIVLNGCVQLGACGVGTPPEEEAPQGCRL